MERPGDITSNEIAGEVHGTSVQAYRISGGVHVHTGQERLVAAYSELADARRQLLEGMQVERNLTQAVWALQTLVLRLQDQVLRLRDNETELRATVVAKERAEGQLDVAEAEQATAVRLLRLARARLAEVQARASEPAELPGIEPTALVAGLDEIDRFLDEQGARLGRLSAELDGVPSITVAVVDDHQVVWHGIRHYLDRADPPVRIVSEADSVLSALTGPGAVADVVIMDLHRPDTGPADRAGSGYLDLQRLVDAGRKVVVCSTRVDRITMVRCMGIGAHTYITKVEIADHLAEAVRAAAYGRVYRAPLLAAAMDLPPVGRPELSPGEREVLLLHCAGMTLVEIAARSGSPCRPSTPGWNGFARSTPTSIAPPDPAAR
ncbi:response regulator transcription factor [Actinokineospora sp. NBRC 105648]|uniref:response regulator transcription factor n=1 Tax=Actinokineospora sp. NBRC 105648 TaxID=3032206 RepID=UPI0024A0B5CC|nr:response regulator transcription factor [Actinokineospora sp. NBRC 105648]GLZ36497.1 hypothetical protein Acsp05_01220 [Actinokineospora sp. NBRC 105648]